MQLGEESTKKFREIYKKNYGWDMIDEEAAKMSLTLGEYLEVVTHINDEFMEKQKSAKSASKDSEPV